MTERGGIYRALCVSNRDPQQTLRIKVKVPQLMGDSELPEWAKPCLPPGWADVASPVKDHTNNGGHAQHSGSGLHSHKHELRQRVPKPGQQVWVMFEGGDVDHPVWMGVA